MNAQRSHGTLGIFDRCLRSLSVVSLQVVEKVGGILEDLMESSVVVKRTELLPFPLGHYMAWFPNVLVGSCVDKGLLLKLCIFW